MDSSRQSSPQDTTVKEFLYQPSEARENSYTKVWVRGQRLYDTGAVPLGRYIPLQPQTSGLSNAEHQNSNQRVLALEAEETTRSRKADMQGDGATDLDERLRRRPVSPTSGLDLMGYDTAQQGMRENCGLGATNRLVATEQSVASAPKRLHSIAFPSHDTKSRGRPMALVQNRPNAGATPFSMPNRGSPPIARPPLDMTMLQSLCNVLVPNSHSAVPRSSHLSGPCYEARPQYHSFLSKYSKITPENRLTVASLAQQQQGTTDVQRRDQRASPSRQGARVESSRAGSGEAGQSSSRRGSLPASLVRPTTGNRTTSDSSRSTSVGSVWSKDASPTNPRDNYLYDMEEEWEMALR